jgi:hypothetical protein
MQPTFFEAGRWAALKDTLLVTTVGRRSFVDSLLRLVPRSTRKSTVKQPPATVRRD